MTVPGAVVGYTVSIADTGQTSYSGITVADDLSGLLPDAAYDGDAVATAGLLSYAGPVLTWTGSLAPGGTVTVTFTVTVRQPGYGDKQLVTVATSGAAGSSCPPGTTAAACRTLVAVLTPALAITIRPAPPPRRRVPPWTYTVTITDTGQTPYTGATVADDLSGVLDDAAYNGDAAATTGTTSYASPALTWTGDLSPGDSATVTFTVTVHNPDTGNKVLATVVTSAADGSNCAAGSTDPACATRVLVSVLAIDSTFSVATVTPGGTLNATTTITNAGQAPYYGISVDFTTANTAAPDQRRRQRDRELGYLVGRRDGGGVDRGRAGRRHGDDHRVDHRRQPLPARRARSSP